jgi:nitrite reductase/ring-hydroxylating ferredoxin subunit
MRRAQLPGEHPIKYLRPEQLLDSIREFDPKYAVSRGEFSIDVVSRLDDMEWNQMDQLHRPWIHNTYQKNIRVALGRDFAVSFTRSGRWPFLITVSDVRVDRGVFYQDMVLAGVFYIHNNITFTQIGESVRLRHEWIIHSHRLLKFVHGIIGRMYRKLNVKLQAEDNVIRSRRLQLRLWGYGFRSDPPDFYNSNQLTNNTVYPPLPEGESIALQEAPSGEMAVRMLGNVEFALRRGENDEVLVWPNACPHEGGALATGRLDKDCKLQCPWHGLKFAAVRLSPAQPQGEAHGFAYRLEGGRIHVVRKA